MKVDSIGRVYVNGNPGRPPVDIEERIWPHVEEVPSPVWPASHIRPEGRFYIKGRSRA